MIDVQTIFLLELVGILDEKRPITQADAMLRLAQWYRDELQDVSRYVEEECRGTDRAILGGESP